MALDQQRHKSGTSDAQSHIQQCSLNCVFRNTCAWTCIVLDCQLSHCLAPILLYQAGQSPTSFFFDDFAKMYVPYQIWWVIHRLDSANRKPITYGQTEILDYCAPSCTRFQNGSYALISPD
ncbi:hypothetical protein AVEN_89044-1 [Araneus ventricosus]|uniref:Uncharacterized protein n=1 Tax=Araneus ventricosus TaxID=182803 RepID=A0A4Y2B3D1_ARAVE|nr:hypothetical protein AVEN_89044-1 [Araneus ventricosus]